MASLALAIAGGVIGGALAPAATGAVVFGLTGAQLGFFIGGLVGSVVDSYLFASDQSIKGPRIDELRFRSAEEGSPITWQQGNHNRVPATLIWAPPFEEVVKKEDAGGKGGGGGTITSYRYFNDVAYLIGDGPIEGVEKIWLNDKLVYQDLPDVEVTSDLLSVRREVVYVWNPQTMSAIELTIYEVIESPVGGPDLTEFHTGADVTISGFANAANNVTRKVIKVEEIAGTGTELWVKNGDAVTEAAGATATLLQTPPQTAGKYADITIYLGTTTQGRDPLIESVEGAGETPAYRSFAYFVLERLALADFGNGLPQASVLCKEHEGRTVAEACANVVARSGKLTAANVDVSAIGSTELEGYQIAGPKQLDAQLLPLVVAYDLLAKRRGEKIVILPRSASDSLDVDQTHLGARAAEDTPVKPFSIEHPSAIRLPTSAVVSYIDEDSDYQRGTQREPMVNQGNNVTVTVDVPIVLSGTQAREIGQRVLWISHGTRRKMQIHLPPSWLHVEPTDLLNVPTGVNTLEMRAAEVTQGGNFVHEISGLINDGEFFGFGAAAEQPQGGGLEEFIQVPPDMTPLVIQIPALAESHLTVGGLYLAAAATDPNAAYLGASWLESLDDTTYDEVASQPTEAAVVRALTTLGDGSPHYIDTLNTVDVEVFDGELSSVTEAEMLEGANALVLGGELIHFQNATQIGVRQYRLDTLVRGARGTELFTGDHQAGELGVLAETGTFQFHQIDLAQYSSARHYKCVAVNADIDEEDDQQVTYEAATVKAFAPGHLVGDYHPVTNDVEFSWVRRTRGFVRFMGDAATAPLYGDAIRFELDILDAPDGNVLRTISVSDAESATYTVAQMIADGITPGDDIDYRIAQVHDELTGRGYIRSGSVPRLASSSAFAHDRAAHSPGYN